MITIWFYEWTCTNVCTHKCTYCIYVIGVKTFPLTCTGSEADYTRMLVSSLHC